MKELAAHTIMACAMLLSIRIIEGSVALLWYGSEMILFGKFPIKYVFHACDASVLAVFLLYGGYKFLRTFYSGKAHD